MSDRRLNDHEHAERARVVEMNDRVVGALTPVFVLIGVVLLAAVPSYGWIIIVPLLIDVVKGNIVRIMTKHVARPDLLCAYDQYTSIVFIGIGVYVSGGASSPFLPFLAIHGALFPVIFPRRYMLIGCGTLTAVILLASTGPAASSPNDGWYRLGVVLSLAFGIWVISRELKRSEVSYRSASLVDELTGLANRRAFDDQFDAVIQRLTVRPEPTALILCDIDFFKLVNDVHGHAVGDDVLAAVGDELADSFRASDGIYRIGGEEFACLLQGVPEDMAFAMAGVLRDRIALTMPAGLEITMSLGVATTSGGETGDELFRRSDRALMEAKRTGRNKVVAARPQGSDEPSASKRAPKTGSGKTGTPANAASSIIPTKSMIAENIRPIGSSKSTEI